MCAHFFKFLSEAQIILERIFAAGWIEDVAGVADSGFANAPGFDGSFNRHFHIGQPVERIENAEDIDTLRGGFGDEGLHGVVGIGGVADSVRGAQQHLETDVWNAFAKFG